MNRYNRGRKPFFLLFILAFFLVGWVVMLLWNAILPELVGVKNIRYGQSLGLLVLCRILFGSFGFKGRGGPGGDGRFGGGPHMRERLMSMTEEERQRFKDSLRNRCKPS